MKRLLAWLLDRADEPSTWRGLFFIGSALGFLTLEPEKAALLSAGLAMVFGGADIATPEPTRKLRPRAPADELRDQQPMQGQRIADADERLQSAADKARESWLD